uniref:Dehydration-responsive protein RD22 n=1 Tax=Cajanus cajan TaxID=3821 RepID=A0A151SGM2_CAJCA|nr:Dehydration-responsive protein RD22 [Cajanus cajan]
MPKAIIDILHPDWVEEKSTSVSVGKGGVNVDTGKTKPGGTSVNVGKGGVNVNVGHGNPNPKPNPKPKPKPKRKGTSVSVGKGGVNVHTGPKGKPDLHQGTKFNLHFTPTSNIEATFLPRTVADSIPFSSNKVSDTLNEFSITPGSDEAQTVKNTLSECQERGIKGEEKRCVTSLESMVDFATSKLGNTVDAVSTEVTKESALQQQQYRISGYSGVKNLGGDHKGVVACHKESYPYAVFYCHKSDSTKVYSVPLEGADGSRVKAVAVCHTDTSRWNPKHLAFKVLKVQPGTVPVCHFLPRDHVVFVPK